MSSKTIRVAKIDLSVTKPTPLSFGDLQTWIIWQFPRLNGEHMLGAVHPPLVDHGWYPAAIDHEGEALEIYAHVGEPAATPEKAMHYFIENPEPTP